MALSTTLRNQQVRQLGFFDEEKEKKKPQKGAAFNDPAFGNNKTLPIHRWVPWIAGFSQNFVRDAILRYMPSQGTVLDPFSGVGTTLVEAILLGHEVLETCRVWVELTLLFKKIHESMISSQALALAKPHE